jgi:hypothetical protein
LLVALPLLGAAPSASAQSGPSLDGWRLTLPVDADGGADGSPVVLDPAELRPPYLSRDGNGDLVMWAPTVGATTSHSGSPRTEFIRDEGFRTGDGDEHTLAAEVVVTQVPDESRTIVLGQIHGGGDLNADPYTLLYFGDGVVHVKVNQQLASGTNYKDYPLLQDVGLGATFAFTITDRGDGTLDFTATTGDRTESATAPVPDVWSGNDVRFQAGDYEQLKGDPSDDDGGRVTFLALDAS